MIVTVVEWIDAKYQAPSDRGPLLLVVEDEEGKRSIEIGRVYPGYTSETVGSYTLAKFDIGLEIWTYRKVTHWAPLPDMPEEVR